MNFGVIPPAPAELAFPDGMPPNIVTLVDVALGRESHAPAVLFDDGVVIIQSDLREAIETFAGWLCSHVAPGDRVVAMLSNRIEMMAAWIATAAVGGLYVSLNPGAGSDDARHVLMDADPTVVIGEATTLKVLAAALKSSECSAELVTVAGEEPFGLSHLVGPRLDLGAASVDSNAAVSVYYTSGTTGLPKGCVVGHDYWLWFVRRWLDLYGMNAGDRLLCCLQFFYGDPPWQFLTSLHAGVPWVVMRRFSVSQFWDVVLRHDVTQLMTLASIPSLLATAPPDPNRRTDRVRFAVQIGVSAADHADWVDRWGFPWLDAYGLTESGLATAVRPLEADENVGSGSIGRPVPGASVRLVDENGSPIESSGIVGEVQLQVPGMFRGYLNRPDATASALVDGWLVTGDLAWRDAQGAYTFGGRLKDIIRRNGENVSAQEVEAVLRSHPSVLEAAVVATPDRLRGEEIVAHIYSAELSKRAETGSLFAELSVWCAERLSAHKVPRYFLMRSTPFDLTPSMRVAKRDLPRTSDNAWDREEEIGW